MKPYCWKLIVDIQSVVKLSTNNWNGAKLSVDNKLKLYAVENCFKNSVINTPLSTHHGIEAVKIG